MRLFFANFRSLRRRRAERHPEAAQQRARLFVRPRRRADRDLHAAQPVDLVVLDLREDQLLLETEGVVAAPVEALVGHTLEIPDARKRHRHQLLEEVPHPLAPQRHLETDRHSDTQPEVRDGFLRLRHDGTLSGDLREIAGGRVHGLRVTDGLAHADVEDDLRDLRDLHDVAVAELLAQLILHGRVVALFQYGSHYLGSSTTIASPQRMHTRSLLFSSIRWATRVGFPQCGQTTMTLPSPSGMGCSMIPPFWFFVGFALVWCLAMFTPATITVWSPGRTSCTRPRLPRSLPVMTMTSS